MTNAAPLSTPVTGEASLSTPAPRPPLPPFDRQAAAEKVRKAEDAWNLRDPHRVAGAYTPDSR